eukprot:jgi/Mesvir1/23239/Mv09241-RA.1
MEDMEFGEGTGDALQDKMDEFDDGDSGYVSEKEGDEKDILNNGGVVKKLVKKGTGWEHPEPGDEVTVHYVGKLLDGTQFDSSRDRGEPFTFKIGQGQVIKGWDEGVGLMKKGEVALITCKPEYAYGAAGSPPTIPPNSTLVFEVELLSWKSVSDICEDGGVIKKVLVPGSNWVMPRKEDEVRVKYTARVKGGDVFESTPDEGIEFSMSKGHLCRAMREAVLTMKKGEQAQLIVRPDYGFGAEGRPPTVPPGATLEIDVTLLSWKTVEDVTKDGGVVKKALNEPAVYKKPNEGAKVKARLVGKLSDGTVFQRHEEGNELEFVTDAGEVILGLDKVVMDMKKEEQAEVVIQPSYGYGESGASEGLLAPVPPNATLHYDITLVSFENAKEMYEMDTNEKFAAAEKCKEEGNAAFKAGNLARAAAKYDKAVRYIEMDHSFSDEEKANAKKLKVTCYLNDAACKLKLAQWPEAARLCGKAINLEKANVKALYRRAQAYYHTNDLEIAEADLKLAIEKEPNNKDLREQLKKVKAKMADIHKQQAKVFGNMFERLQKLEKKEGVISHDPPKKAVETVENFDRASDAPQQTEEMPVVNEAEVRAALAAEAEAMQA